MQSVSQSLTEDTFVQNPYPFYAPARARAAGPLAFRDDYAIPVARRMRRSAPSCAIAASAGSRSSRAPSAGLLGVPEDMADDLLRWSNAMVTMHQAGRTRADEESAVAATEPLVAFMRSYVDQGRNLPPDRSDGPANLAFGAGLRFCVGTRPLARLELQIALKALFRRCPALSLAQPPRYAGICHCHGLERLEVTRGPQ